MSSLSDKFEHFIDKVYTVVDKMKLDIEFLMRKIIQEENRFCDRTSMAPQLIQI